MPPLRPIIVRAAPLLIFILLIACATNSTVQSRRLEKLPAYEALSADEKSVVDAEQIRIGLSMDAVYIAWGKPSEVLESEDAQGRFTTWRFYGSWLQENRYWAYREVSHADRRGASLERYLVSDYNPRDYVRSEIIFHQGKVLSWRTLPKPLE